MGLCNNLYDHLPDENFLRDLDTLHVWKPNPFRMMAIEFSERLEHQNFVLVIAEF